MSLSDAAARSDDRRHGARQKTSVYAASTETERAGFEPAMEFNPHTRLAGECLQPLGHLSWRWTSQCKASRRVEVSEALRAGARGEEREPVEYCLRLWCSTLCFVCCRPSLLAIPLLARRYPGERACSRCVAWSGPVAAPALLCAAAPGMLPCGGARRSPDGRSLAVRPPPGVGLDELDRFRPTGASAARPRGPAYEGRGSVLRGRPR